MVRSLRDVDFVAYDGKAGKVLDVSLSATQGRVLICRTCEPGGMNRPTYAKTLKEPLCDHILKALLSREDVGSVDTGPHATENDCSLAVPLTRSYRACASLALRPVEAVEPDREYAGPLVVTYHLPGWQSDATKALELDVLPRYMVNRLELRASLLYYLTAKWLPRLSEPFPCDRNHTYQTFTNWSIITKALEKFSINELTKPRQAQIYLTLYTLDQWGRCSDCAMFDPNDDVPKV